MSDTYPIAPDGIFYTLQGEGALSGEPMAFVRLAGCSIGCEYCDTDYRVSRRLTAVEVAQAVAAVMPPHGRWVWVTGGEPTDHNLQALQRELRRLGPHVHLALATAGHKQVPQTLPTERWDWISVSPHDPAQWRQFSGSELKLVPGLNGFKLADFAAVIDREQMSFCHRYAQPLWSDAASLEECKAWVMAREGWRLGAQSHKSEWKVP